MNTSAPSLELNRRLLPVATAAPSETAPAGTARRRGPVFKRVLLLGLALAAGAGAARAGHHWWTVGRFIESTDDAYVGGDVTVIAPKVPGFIGEVLVTDNQPVHAGEVIIRLDDRDYRAALAKTEAAVASQRAALANLDATRFLQESVVTQAQAGITAAESEITRTRDDQARYQALARQGAVSVQNRQKAEADYQQAEAAGERARAAMATAQRQLAVIETQKRQAQAALDQAEAERELARLNLGYTELRAPIDGIVGNRSARPGAYATVGSQLVSLVPVKGLWIDANFKESQLAMTRPGQPAEVIVDALPGVVLHGHVGSLAPATGAQFSVLPPENATGNFTKIVQRVAVRILLDEASEQRAQIRPGLSVTVDVDGRAAAGKEAL